MNWEKIRNIGYRLQLTKNEQSVLLFLAGMLLTGSAIIGFDFIVGTVTSEPRRYDYGSLDYEFQERLARDSTSKINTSGLTAAPSVSVDRNTATTNQRGKKTPPTQPINLNTATATALTQLPGVGPSTAEKIIQYRTEHGKFKKIEDIKKVKSIGDKKFEKFKAFITVR